MVSCTSNLSEFEFESHFFSNKKDFSWSLNQMNRCTRRKTHQGARLLWSALSHLAQGFSAELKLEEHKAQSEVCFLHDFRWLSMVVFNLGDDFRCFNSSGLRWVLEYIVWWLFEIGWLRTIVQKSGNSHDCSNKDDAEYCQTLA